MFSPPDCWDPPATSSRYKEVHPYYGQKKIPLTAGTQQLYLRTQGSASLSSLIAGTHPVEAYVPLSVLSKRVRTYWSIDLSANMNCGRVSSGTCHSRAPHVAVQAVPSKPQPHAKKYDHVRTYGRGLERLLAHTYGQGSCTWLGQNGETASSCSSGANRLGRKSRSKRGLAYRGTEETALCSTGHGRNGILFIGRGLAYRKTEETDFRWTSYGRNGVLLTGRGVAYRKTEETDLCWSAMVGTGVLFIGRGVAYRKMGLHEILFISTIDCLHGLLFI